MIKIIGISNFLYVLLLLPTSGWTVENPIFGYTHILPSPFTLPAGRIMIGSTTGIGITDSIEIKTNAVADLYQIYNGTLRYSLLDFPGLAFGIDLGYQYVNLNSISSRNPDIGIGAWLPGAVIGLEVLPDLALFLGGTLFLSDRSLDFMQVSASGLLQGNQYGADLSWAYSPHANLTGNVLSAGVSYNSTFNFYGVGLSHHWKGLHVGLHYYPNVPTSPKILPVLSGSATVDL